MPKSTHKQTLQNALKALWRFKLGDGNGYPITSKQLKENEQYYGKIPDGLPFFCEANLYTLLGKEDARTILALMHKLNEAANLNHFEDFQ